MWMKIAFLWILQIHMNILEKDWATMDMGGGGGGGGGGRELWRLSGICTNLWSKFHEVQLSNQFNPLIQWKFPFPKVNLYMGLVIIVSFVTLRANWVLRHAIKMRLRWKSHSHGKLCFFFQVVSLLWTFFFLVQGSSFSSYELLKCIVYASSSSFHYISYIIWTEHYIIFLFMSTLK